MLITPEQKEFYETNGYLMVSGLIPEALLNTAVEAMWEAIGASPDDPNTWQTTAYSPTPEHNQKIVACYTPEILQAASELVGDPLDTFQPPPTPFPINVFPTTSEWEWYPPHIDHSIKEHGHHTFPRPYRIASMLYLNGAGVHGATTVVWSGSHKKVLALAQSDPTRYALMWTLNQDLDKADIGNRKEVPAKPGDILFYDYLLAHTGSMNTGKTPRLAMNRKW